MILIASIQNWHDLYAKLHVPTLQGPSLFSLLSKIKDIGINTCLYFYSKSLLRTSLVPECSGLAPW